MNNHESASIIQEGIQKQTTHRQIQEKNSHHTNTFTTLFVVKARAAEIAGLRPTLTSFSRMFVCSKTYVRLF